MLPRWLSIVTCSAWCVVQAPGASARPAVPLREGLTIVTAVNNGTADFESVKRIATVDAAIVRVTVTSDMPSTGGSTPVVRSRVIRRADLESAHGYYWDFRPATPESYPGTTALGVSAGVLRELEGAGEATLTVPAGTTPASLTGTLRRVEPAPVPFRIIVNDETTELPALHARGELGDQPAEFWILDDLSNPLALRWTIGAIRLQAVKVSYPVPDAPAARASHVEGALATEGRAVLYGIYFDTASDRLKPESDAVLAEIADVLRRNPAWALSVEGHTDNLGGDAYNQDLSTRRAAAVKQALVTTYQIAASRLRAAGFGASRPKDSNDTLEGRARNRRVELVRQHGSP